MIKKVLFFLIFCLIKNVNCNNTTNNLNFNENDWDNATWVLTSSFIIITMQSGFGLLESGLVSKKKQFSYNDKKYIRYYFWWTNFLDFWICNNIWRRIKWFWIF